ncbi:MAG: hypothetical protein UC755_01460 [Oscillospiraceae bacterium]|nr:hypothetical protein [Oscillospiraceae bacterium]
MTFSPKSRTSCPAAVISSKSASRYGSTSENDFSTLCATKLQYAHLVGQNGMPT